MRPRQERQAQPDGYSGERLLDTPPAARAGGAEANELVFVPRRLGEARNHSPHVVADARPGKRERADVDDDAHGTAEYPA